MRSKVLGHSNLSNHLFTSRFKAVRLPETQEKTKQGQNQDQDKPVWPKISFLNPKFLQFFLHLNVIEDFARILCK